MDWARIASSAATSDGLVNGCGRRTSQRSSASSPAPKHQDAGGDRTSAGVAGCENAAA